MDSRLPPTLRVNRGDIKELNDRANLIKIINDRKNALKRRKELSKEYDDIMKKIYKSQQKKKKRIAKGRGGIRGSRSQEKRAQERQKRGERRAEGEDEPTIIGEEVKKDAEGNILITYRDYEKEAQAKAEDRQERQQQILRLDDIRREDMQLRFDERQIDRDDRIRRQDREYRIAREGREREDLWRDLVMRREDENMALNRALEGRRLDYLQAQMGQGRDFLSALQKLEGRLNKRFDTRLAQYLNLVDTAPNSLAMQDLGGAPQIQEIGDAEYQKLEEDLEELQEGAPKVFIPTEETAEDFETPIKETPLERMHSLKSPTPEGHGLIPPSTEEVSSTIRSMLTPLGHGLIPPPSPESMTPQELLVDLQTMEWQGEGALAGEYFAEEGQPAPEPEGFDWAQADAEVLKKIADSLKIPIPANPGDTEEFNKLVRRKLAEKLQVDPELYKELGDVSNWSDSQIKAYTSSFISPAELVEIPSAAQPIRPQSTPATSRIYTEDLKPQGEDYGVEVGGEKELRQPREKGRSFKQDIEIISGTPMRVKQNTPVYPELAGDLFVSPPDEGTPKRIVWENLLTSGNLEPIIPELKDLGEEEAVDKILEIQEQVAEEIRRIEKLKQDHRGDGKFDREFSPRRTPTSLGLDISFTNPLKELDEEAKQEIIDAMNKTTYVDENLNTTGFVNPLLELEEQSSAQEEFEKEGLISVSELQTPKGESTQGASQPQGEDTAELPQPKFDLDKLQAGMTIKYPGYSEGTISHVEKNEGKYKGQISFKNPDDPPMHEGGTQVIIKQHHHKNIEYIGGFKTEQKGPGSMKDVRLRTPGDRPRALKLPMGEKFVSPQPQLEVSTASVSDEAQFIPDKYTKGQDVSYYGKNKQGKLGWRDAKIDEYKDGGPDGALLSVNFEKKSRDTTMVNVLPKPTDAELLLQKELREELKGGILREGENRKADKKGSFWEGKDKYLLHNNTPHEFRGIQPYGKSLIHYHKDNPQQHKGQKGKKFTEFSYYHTPLDDEGKGMEQATGKRIIGPLIMDPAIEQGLIRLEKLDEVYPYERGSKKEKREKRGKPFGSKEGFVEAPQPREAPSMLAGAGEVVGNIAGGVASAGAGLIGGIAGGVAAQLPTPYEAGVGVGGALAGAGVGLIQGAAGLVAGAIGGAEEEEDV